jgi:hypothetical protein
LGKREREEEGGVEKMKGGKGRYKRKTGRKCGKDEGGEK